MLLGNDKSAGSAPDISLKREASYTLTQFAGPWLIAAAAIHWLLRRIAPHATPAPGSRDKRNSPPPQ